MAFAPPNQQEARTEAEAMLTRAVYRVLAAPQWSDTGVGRGTAPHRGPGSVDKTSTHTMRADDRVQLRLVAEQLVRRVNRRVDRQREEERQREGQEAERRLGELKAEWAAEREALRRELDRDRQRLEQQCAEKERGMRHQYDMRMTDKEASLSLERRRLESRLAELMMNKEQLDRVRDEFKRKMCVELEWAQQERARLALMEAELVDRADKETREATADLTERLLQMEKRLEEEKKGREGAERERDEWQEKARQGDGWKEEGQEARARHASTLDMLKQAEERLASQWDYAELKEEVAGLRSERLEWRRQSERAVEREMERERARRGLEHQAEKERERELKMIMAVMSDKLRALTSERNYLREELKEERKRQWRGAEKEEREGGKWSRSMEKAKRSGGDRGGGGKGGRRWSLSSSESGSSAGSSRSGEDSDIRQIRDRMNRLNAMAKELDSHVEQLSVHVPRVGGTVDEVEGLDRWCRSRREPSSAVRSEVENEEKERSRLEQSAVEEELREAQRRVADARRRQTELEREQRGERRRSSARQLWGEEEEEKKVVVEERERRRGSSAEYHSAKASPKSSPVKSPKKMVAEPVAVQAPPPQAPPSRTAEEEFAERMRRRAEEREQRMVPVATSTPKKSPPREQSVEEGNKEEEGGMFEGVDPVMAKYMEMVMKQRGEKKEEATVPSTAVQTRQEESSLDELESVGEIAVMDKPGDSDDDIQW